MALITLSQSMGSADTGIAQSVAEKLNLELFDDQRIREKATQLGIQPDDLKGLDEKTPGFFDRLLSNRPQSYIQFLESVIYEIAKAGSGVIMGHGSQILLRDFSCALHVLIHAPESYRIESVAKNQGLSPDAAQKLIQKSDHERKGFFNFAFNKNWNDPSLYDLVINTGKMGAEAAVDLIVASARLDQIKTCSLTALETMEKRSQERAVRAILLKNNVNLSLLSLEVPRKGTTLIKGFAYSPDDIERITKLVRSVPGIGEVKTEISIPKNINY